MGIARKRVVTVAQVNNEQCYSARATAIACKPAVGTAESDPEHQATNRHDCDLQTATPIVSHTWTRQGQD